MSPNEQNTLGIGTQKFMAPEILNEEEYDEKVDVYSFGFVAFFALNNGEMPVTKMRDVMIGKKPEIPSSFTSFAKRLIDSCWNFDPKDRPSFNRICVAIATRYLIFQATKSANLKKVLKSTNYEFQFMIIVLKNKLNNQSYSIK